MIGAGNLYYFDLYSALAAEGDPAPAPQAGNYLFDTANGYSDFSIAEDGSFMDTFTGEGDELAKTGTTKYTAAEVRFSEKNGSYEAVAYVTLATGEKLKITCPTLKIVDKSQQAEGGSTLDQDVNLTLTTAAGAYYGDAYENSTTEYDLGFITEDKTQGIFLELIGPATADFASSALPAGTYTVGENPEVNTCMQGIEFMGLTFGTYYKNGAGVLGMVNSGTVVVGKTGNNFTVTIDCMTDNGHKVQGSYTGPIAFEDATKEDPTPGGDSWTTLTGDVTADFSAVTAATAEFYGDYAQNGTGNFLLNIDAESPDTEGFILDFYTASASSATAIEGTYTASADNTANTFQPGSADDEYIYPTSYIGYDSEGDLTTFAPAITGTVKITKSGANYKFEIDVYDDAATPNHITGTWTGPVNITDKTAGASTKISKASRNLRPAAAPRQLQSKAQSSLKSMLAASKAQQPAAR